MSTVSRQRPPSVPSTISLNNASGSRPSRRPPPPVAKVITSPPWARDEPPSPKEQIGSSSEGVHDPQSRISDSGSFNASPTQEGSRWWSFTLPRVRDQPFDLNTSPTRSERKGFRDRSLSWLPTSASIREGTFARKEKDKDLENGTAIPSLPLATHPTAPFTMSISATPGWDVPWSSRLGSQGPQIHGGQDTLYDFGGEEIVGLPNKNNSPRRNQLRSFILTNTYVPLLFRFINIAFTTGALGTAIRIRKIELKNHAMGAVGSSPTVVIIFAPLTLVHVISAIYLEYFGRPLGLWRTSAKLAHTLSEVLFICAWSAALSLCFDNFFTSLVPCASSSSTSWYNELPRPEFNRPELEGTLGDRICESQLALICLVGVGLIAYCTNLVISLYRIFEKVKYHPPATRTR